MNSAYPLSFKVDYPGRPLNRLTTFFRPLVALPVALVQWTLGGLLLDDEYPSTDDAQHVHLEVEYPDADRDLNRWMPLVKWFLAIPHYVVPRALFDYVEGVLRWHE